MSEKSLDHRTNSERQISKFQNTPQPVIYEIDDDDDDDEVSEVDNHHHLNSSTNNNIVVQDDIIELDDDCDISITASNENTRGTTGYQTKECTIISKTIESITNICTDIDDSDQMKRILRKNLMAVYRECVSKNVNKHKIMSILDTTSRSVQAKPEYRYSYLINCCNKLKKLQRKKVPFVTLSDKASKRPKNITKRPNYNLTNNTKKPKLDNNIIDLDNDTPEEDVIVVTERQTNGEHINLDSEDEAQVPSYSNKENISNGKDTITTITTTTVLNQTQRIDPNNDGNTEKIDLYKCYSSALKVAEESHAASSHIDKETKIKLFEDNLKILKETLDRIELFEVTTDNMYSPYIMAETIKTRIIKIYKQLCELTGTNYVKRHEVRLKVNMGHLEGAVRLLEQYINNNIDEQGNPPFPDLEEVSKCVSQANVMYNMGWSQKQIDDEARKLQKHYGQKIQQRRQKREWLDLLHICKEEVLDPADIDPELEAKLVANRRIAKKNEDEVFNKFVKMEERRFSRTNDYEIDMESDDSNDSFIENDGNNQDKTSDVAQNIPNSVLTNMAPTVPKSAIVTTRVLSNIIPYVSLPSLPSLGTPTIIGHPVNDIQSQTLPITAISVNNSALSTAEIIAANNLNPNSNNGWTLFQNIDGNQCLRLQTVEVSFESNGAETELVNKVSSEIDKVIETQENMNADDKQPEMVEDNSSDTQPLLLEEPLETEIIKDDLNSLNIVIENPISLAKLNNDENVSRDNVQESVSSSDNVIDINTDNIKKEPPERTEVIIKLLEELGDDFTASISYIEDPFLVIEISDSSDSENES